MDENPYKSPGSGGLANALLLASITCGGFALMLAAWGLFDLSSSFRQLQTDEAKAMISVAVRMGIAAIGMYAAYRFLRWL
jgi:hypothetical protein